MWQIARNRGCQCQALRATAMKCPQCGSRHMLRSSQARPARQCLQSQIYSIQEKHKYPKHNLLSSPSPRCLLHGSAALAVSQLDKDHPHLKQVHLHSDTRLPQFVTLNRITLSWAPNSSGEMPSSGFAAISVLSSQQHCVRPSHLVQPRALARRGLHQPQVSWPKRRKPRLMCKICCHL